MTLFFSTVSPNGVNTFNQQVITKSDNQYFTREECDYVQEIFLQEMRTGFDVAKKDKGLKQISLGCVSVAPLIKKEEVHNPSVVPFKEKKGTGYKFNGAVVL